MLGIARSLFASNCLLVSEVGNYDFKTSEDIFFLFESREEGQVNVSDEEKLVAGWTRGAKL
ncbi:uncharacterized protein N7518_008940 [Penicillium psychrosexuale]|uniref:uncharacterized protein n=1 Tax=Penicillium psychrosexuale TaxID=1002107 RepID=UPI0025457E71|nr:uncharacterized protein N7518_008940 [Penicillium psychrosexuale]KAJ5791929.1 hypothetical protein N7518_008940 [Penicillium psychrosexuale]